MAKQIELLLLDTIENLGIVGDVVKVKPGYARNYLLPHGLATVATEENKKMVELHKEKLKAIESTRIRNLTKIADAVSKYSATIEANATGSWSARCTGGSEESCSYPHGHG